MKQIQIAMLILALVALTLPLAGCPGKKMMRGDITPLSSVENIG